MIAVETRRHAMTSGRKRNAPKIKEVQKANLLGNRVPQGAQLGHIKRCPSAVSKSYQIPCPKNLATPVSGQAKVPGRNRGDAEDRNKLVSSRRRAWCSVQPPSKFLDDLTKGEFARPRVCPQRHPLLGCDLHPMKPIIWLTFLFPSPRSGFLFLCLDPKQPSEVCSVAYFFALTASESRTSQHGRTNGLILSWCRGVWSVQIGIVWREVERENALGWGKARAGP